MSQTEYQRDFSQAALRCVGDHAGILRCRLASRPSATVIDTPAQIAGHIKMTTNALTPNGNAAKSANVITHLTARAIHVRAVSQANVLPQLLYRSREHQQCPHQYDQV